MSELLKPPVVPTAILNFFACRPDFPVVAGDISEEFHQRAQNSGANAAKRWYWRQAFRNAWALTAREFMEFLRMPVRTTIIALSCIFAVREWPLAVTFTVFSVCFAVTLWLCRIRRASKGASTHV